ncbi:MAG: hypothetical protein ACKOQW_05125 [Phycisphaerales bacterium]
MKNAELIIFILVVLINGGIALWKKYAELKAKRAAQAVARPSAMSRAPVAAAPRPVATPKAAPAAKPKPVAKPKPPAKPKAKPAARPKPPVPPKVAAKVPPAVESRPTAPSTRGAAAVSAAISPRRIAPVAAMARPATLRGALGGRSGLRRAILLREVLGPPRALEPWRG